MITFCVIAVIGGLIWFAVWLLFRPLKDDTANRQDLLEHLVEIDAEILDLIDERADTVEALWKLGHVGRA